MTRLTWAWDSVEPPCAFSGSGIVGVQEAANAVLAAGDADDYFIFDGQRRSSHAVSLRVVRDFDIPDDGAGLAVQRYQARVDCSHEKPVADHRQAAVYLAAAYVN